MLNTLIQSCGNVMIRLHNDCDGLQEDVKAQQQLEDSGLILEIYL
tara:strand:- start:631 stop:765 length:135 start_codon:yes stop_codon:yes gene_type:complete